MSDRIRVLAVAGPDADIAYLRELAAHLDGAWFHLTGMWIGEGPAPIAGWDAVAPSRWRPWAVRRAIRRRAASVDMVDGHGYVGFWSAMRSGLWVLPSVYTRTAEPMSRGARQREAWLMGQADAIVAVRSAAAPAGRRAWVLSEERPGVPIPAREEARRQLGLADDVPVVVLMTEGEPTVLEQAVRDGAGRATVLTVAAAQADGAEGRRILAASDIVVVAGATARPSTLRLALAAGAATLLPREPSVAGQVRCPRDAWLLDPGQPAVWRESVGALVEDGDLREALAAGARAWRAGLTTLGRIREIQGIYAGVVAGRTGRCPVCPEAAAVEMPSEPGERPREITGSRE